METYSYYIRAHGAIYTSTIGGNEQIYAIEIPSNIEVLTYTPIGKIRIEIQHCSRIYDFICNYKKKNFTNILIIQDTPGYKYKYKYLEGENTNSYLFPEILLQPDDNKSSFIYGIIHCDPTTNEQQEVQLITDDYSLSKAIIAIQNHCRKTYRKTYSDYDKIQIHLGSCLSTIPARRPITNTLVNIEAFHDNLDESYVKPYSYSYENITFIIKPKEVQSREYNAIDDEQTKQYHNYLQEAIENFSRTYGRLSRTPSPIISIIDLTTVTTDDEKKSIIQEEFKKVVLNNNLESKYQYRYQYRELINSQRIEIHVNIDIYLTHDQPINESLLSKLNESIFSAIHELSDRNLSNLQFSMRLQVSDLSKPHTELVSRIKNAITEQISSQPANSVISKTIETGRKTTLQEKIRQAKEAKEAREEKTETAGTTKLTIKQRKEERANAKARAKEVEAKAETEEVKAKVEVEVDAETKARAQAKVDKTTTPALMSKRWSFFSKRPKTVTIGGKKKSHKSKKYRGRHTRRQLKRHVRRPTRIHRRTHRRIHRRRHRRNSIKY